MNKEQTIEKINNLPLFVKREVAVYDNGEPKHVGYNDFAITEDNKIVPICFITNKYKLVQFREIFNQMISPFEDFDAALWYNNGFGIMDIFLNDEKYKIDDETRIGISSYNSVDKTCAVNIRFTILNGRKIILMPNAIMKKTHIGKVNQSIKDYSEMIYQIRDYWMTISSNLMKRLVTEDELPAICKSLKIPEDEQDKIKDKLYRCNLSIWDIFNMEYNRIIGRTQKSEIHKRKRLDELSEALMLFDFTAKLGG